MVFGTRSLEDVPKFFEITSLSGILERSLPTKIIPGFSEELRVQRSSKDLRKIFEMKAHSRIFARSSASKIIQGSSEVLRYQISSKDLFLTVYRKTLYVTSEEQFCCPSGFASSI